MPHRGLTNYYVIDRDIRVVSEGPFWGARLSVKIDAASLNMPLVSGSIQYCQVPMSLAMPP